MFESSITVKGQTTLPKAVRESLSVKAGDRVRYVILDEGVLIMPVRSTSRPKPPVHSLRSSPPTTRASSAGKSLSRRRGCWSAATGSPGHGSPRR